ncbi:hypothetical protein HK100_004723 [Physocladia obscura]|uniref:RRM domain-containing protein n=1 Tax=Physocladia obscura TaxID=109957 RepID=A0AAD5SSH6_9FUNG|nr:hypothetical protein HK100_004723 [Physocladia obscura]
MAETDSDVSDEDINPALKNTEDYMELMRLKALAKMQKRENLGSVGSFEVMHYGFACDSCQISPIVGITQSRAARGKGNNSGVGPDGLPRAPRASNSNATTHNSRRRGAGNSQGKARQATPYAHPTKSAPGPVVDQSKLTVSNLNPNVTQQDLHELFSTIGPVKSAVLNFDHTGKSTGTGTVIYRRSGDSQRAITEFNGRQFDGRPMRIELIVSASSIAALQARAAPVANSGSSQPRGASNSSRGAGRGRGNVRSGRGGRGPKGPAKTPEELAAQLDAEMDKYMQDETMGDAAMTL